MRVFLYIYTFKAESFPACSSYSKLGCFMNEKCTKKPKLARRFFVLPRTVTSSQY
jgi:hypothetical protein